MKIGNVSNFRGHRIADHFAISFTSPTALPLAQLVTGSYVLSVKIAKQAPGK